MKFTVNVNLRFAGIYITLWMVLEESCRLIKPNRQLLVISEETVFLSFPEKVFNKLISLGMSGTYHVSLLAVLAK